MKKTNQKPGKRIFLFLLALNIVLIFSVVRLSALPAPSVSPTPRESPPSLTPVFTGQEIFDAVNNYRKENGINELKLDMVLCNNLAQRYFDIKSGLEDGVAHKGFAEWYEEFIEPYGYTVNEVFAWGRTPGEVIKSWEGSPGHRLAILNPENKIGCAYAADGHAVVILGQKLSYIKQSRTQTQNKVPSRTGKIIPYHEWCTGKDISIYENELITKPSSDGSIYTMTQGDWDCYENHLTQK